MIASIAPLSPPSSVFSFQKPSIIAKKVISVALACLALFKFQMALAWGVVLPLAFVASVLTFLTANKEKDWFHFFFEKSSKGVLHDLTGIENPYKATAAIVVFCLLKPFLIRAILFLFGGSLPQPAQTSHLRFFKEHPFLFSWIACVNAPISEEIIFRGALSEFLEFFSPSPWMADLLSSFLFGIAHLRSQIKAGMHLLLLFILSWMGFLLARIKREQNTLMAPMLIHSANNASACLHFSQL